MQRGRRQVPFEAQSVKTQGLTSGGFDDSTVCKGEGLIWCGEEKKGPKGRESEVVIISGVNIGMYHLHRGLVAHGDGMRECRRGAVNVKGWACGKAGEDGPVMGGVVLR